MFWPVSLHSKLISLYENRPYIKRPLLFADYLDLFRCGDFPNQDKKSPEREIKKGGKGLPWIDTIKLSR